MKLKVGDFVVLKKSAIKDFYGRPDRIEDFAVGGNLEALNSDQVIEFIDSYLGFENGQSIGIVDQVDISAIKVRYILTIKEGTDFMYYCQKDLKKINTVVVLCPHF